MDHTMNSIRQHWALVIKKVVDEIYTKATPKCIEPKIARADIFEMLESLSVKQLNSFINSIAETSECKSKSCKNCTKSNPINQKIERDLMKRGME